MLKDAMTFSFLQEKSRESREKFGKNLKKNSEKKTQKKNVKKFRRSRAWASHSGCAPWRTLTA
jgi:hypothetical protein